MKNHIKISLLVAGVCLSGLSAAPAYAAFENGGFESGNFTGWDLDGGKWHGGLGTYTFSGDQGKSTIVGAGMDPILAAAGIDVPMVFSGNYAARANNQDSGYHFSTISQTMVWTDPKMYFAFNAVLQEPSNGVAHSSNQEPHFAMTVKDLTTGSTLYDMHFGVDTIPAGMGGMIDLGGDNVWLYTGWQAIGLDTFAAIGDTLQIQLLASDCALGGHGGYAYLDSFGNTPPVPNPGVTFGYAYGDPGSGGGSGGTVPEPMTVIGVLMGIAGISRYVRRRVREEFLATL